MTTIQNGFRRKRLILSIALSSCVIRQWIVNRLIARMIVNDTAINRSLVRAKINEIAPGVIIFVGKQLWSNLILII